MDHEIFKSTFIQLEEVALASLKDFLGVNDLFKQESKDKTWFFLTPLP